MSNFRMIYDNAADRAALSVSSSASPALGVANLVTDVKGEVWRAAGTTATITGIWDRAEMVGGVMLPYANLSSSAMLRVRAYTQTNDAVPIFDSGPVLACPPAPFEQFGWGTELLGVNAYSYGGVSCGRLWFPMQPIRKIEILIDDTTNPAGYIEVGRLIAGRYWEGKKNVDYGASITAMDTTINSRSDSGDLVSDNGTVYRKLSFSLSNMDAAERNNLWNVVWGNGKRKPVFFSLFPNESDTAAEQQGQIYCKLVNSPAMSMPSFLTYASTLEFEEI